MAGRPIGKLHQEDVRRKIQVSQLLNVLQNHALAESDDESEISMSRMKAIEILLRKSLPDLSAMQIDEGKGEASVADVVRSFHERRASGS